MTQLTDPEIKEFLENAPLYVWREYSNSNGNRSSLQINQVDSHCDVCGQDRPFQDLRSRGGGAGMAVHALATGTTFFQFTCVSCRKEKREFIVEHTVNDGVIRMQKYGERPRRRLVKDRIVAKFLKDDLENYEKAVVCLSHGYGVGAFAYFRRVVENNISSLLALVEEDAQTASDKDKILNALAELRKESPMSEKIKVANFAVPEYLRPGGANPLGRLYQVLSEGVHSLTDEECLQKARLTSECLSFLVSELSARRENRDRFKSVLGNL